MWPNPQGTADMVTFTTKILNGKLRFLCSDISMEKINAFDTDNDKIFLQSDRTRVFCSVTYPADPRCGACTGQQL